MASRPLSLRWWAARLSILAIRLLRALPLPAARRLMTALGHIAYYLVPRVRRVGRRNLDLAYGDTIDNAAKTRILHGAVANVAQVAAELVHMPRLARGNGGDGPVYARGWLPSGLVRGSRSSFTDHVAIEGIEHVDLTRGLLCIGGHLGNWEWMAAAMASTGHRVAEVVRPLDDPALNTVVDELRTGGGITTIPKDDAGREIIRLIREGWLVGLLIDQSPRRNGAPTQFFGQPCWSTIAPAMIAARTKAPVHVVSMLRAAPGRYTLRFLPALDLVRTGDLRRDLVENTQRCQDAFERVVREHPEQWLWFHRRWKHREHLAREWGK